MARGADRQLRSSWPLPAGPWCTMKGDQRYFPVYDKSGKLLPKFIFVTNIESKDPSQIISGNEKVVPPSL